ncbi:MAG: hypothetical protein QOI47_1590 [Actinomycetota bacterium]|nr:hypothetical protein [Actinomycetota bacterium]
MTTRLRWWKEAIYVLLFYGVYSVIRNQFGSAAVSRATALRHARDVIHIERLLCSFHDQAIQHAFLDAKWFVQFWNIFYGTFHFVVTTFCIVWLFRKFPERYVRYRTALAVTTALALIGFATFPLMPPRLLPSHYGFVDTLRDYGGLWSFDSGAMQKVSNQYAAMPSLHFGWSSWCALVLVPTVRRRWLKVLCALYPACTLFAIVVTGNHYWLDAAGGALILAVGYAVGTWWSARSNAVPETIGSTGRPSERRDSEDRVPAVDDDGVAGVVAGSS